MCFVRFIGAPDVSSNTPHIGRPRPNHKFSDPCGTPALRYPPFLCRPCPVRLSRSKGLPAFIASSNVLDLPPGGRQSLKFPFSPYLLHIPSLLLYSQHPAQYSLAWTLQLMSRPGTSRPHMLRLPVMLCLLCCTLMMSQWLTLCKYLGCLVWFFCVCSLIQFLWMLVNHPGKKCVCLYSCIY